VVTRVSSATSRQSIEANVAATGSLPQSPAGSVVVVVGAWVVVVTLDVIVVVAVVDVVVELVEGLVRRSEPGDATGDLIGPAHAFAVGRDQDRRRDGWRAGLRVPNKGVTNIAPHATKASPRCRLVTEAKHNGKEVRLHYRRIIISANDLS
jgi:hypothetical protein